MMDSRRDALHWLRAMADKFGLVERRSTEEVHLSMHFLEEYLSALYDPTRAGAGIRLLAAIGPVPAEPARQQRVTERLLEINHVYGKRFGYGLALSSPKESASREITLQAALGGARLGAESFFLQLRLFALAAREARALLGDVVFEERRVAP